MSSEESGFLLPTSFVMSVHLISRSYLSNLAQKICKRDYRTDRSSILSKKIGHRIKSVDKNQPPRPLDGDLKQLKSFIRFTEYYQCRHFSGSSYSEDSPSLITISSGSVNPRISLATSIINLFVFT